MWISSLSELEDGRCKIVKVASRVGIVEAFGETVDEDTWVRAVDLDARVGSILMIDRQETGTHRRLIGVLGNDLALLVPETGGGAATSASGLDSSNLGNTKESTLGEEESPENDSEGNSHSSVNTVLNGAENDNENTSDEDDKIQRSHTVKLDGGSQRGDDIHHSVDNDGSKRGVWNVVEQLGERIEGEQDNNGSDNTGEWGTNTSLGLDSSSGERSSSRISTEERTKQVGNADGNKLLGRVNDIVVDSAERLGNGNMLDKHNNDGARKLASKGLDDPLVNNGDGGMLETSGNILDDAE